MNAVTDGKKARSNATRKALMLAAEKLIAEKGIENVSIRELVKAAGQKNESVLQYHFKNLKGLVAAIHQQRNEQTQNLRAELLQALMTVGNTPELRDLCGLMVKPTFLLAQAKPEYRRYVVAFGHTIALTTDSALSLVQKHGGGGESGRQTGDLLRAALPELDESAYRQRMDIAVRLSSIAMSHHARQKHAFRGPQADYFLSSLIDAVEGVLGGPVSPETRAIAELLESPAK